MTDPKIWVMLLAIAVLGIVIGYFYHKNISEKKRDQALSTADMIISNAKKESEQIKKEKLIEAKDEVHRLRSDAEKENKERRSELQSYEKRLIQKEESLDKKMGQLENKDQKMNVKIQKLEQEEEKLENLYQQQTETLETIAKLSFEDARLQLLDQAEKEIRHDLALKVKDLESKAKEEADKNAREIITYAIQKCAADQVAETTVSVVQLPNDEMKGRIIGREGRNIRTLESLTGIDIIIDDTPEAVVLSGFDPVRREIARIALEKLIADGRIHPARIEEMVEKAKKEVDRIMKEEGEKAIFETGLFNVHPELVKLLGRLKYRTSYGQNVLKHSVEISHLCGIIATELGVDVKIAKRAGLFHDIGKALDHELEGTHVEIGMNLLKKYKESDAVIHAMSTHHGDYEPQTLEAVIVTAADAISAARPGARRETLEAYIQRLEKLENIANTHQGVDKSFAIQAGREIRIMVYPDQVQDDHLPLLAREISKQIESEMDYPGQIKVSIIRETRVVDYAK